MADILESVFDICVVHYLDNYIVISPTYEGTTISQLVTIRLLRYLGFHVAWRKVTPPSVRAIYLGIQIDTVNMCPSLPAEKVEKFKRYVTKYLRCKFITKKELECLNGLLAHCSQIVQGGRIFSRCCFDMYQCIIASGLARVRISPGMKNDLQWWSDFAPFFNGLSLIPYVVYPSEIWTDSSLKGFGAALDRDWLAGDWDNVFTNIEMESECNHFVKPPILEPDQVSNINVIELFAVVAALERWAPIIGNHMVHIRIDNMQVVSMLSNHSSINKQCMDWLRRLFWLCMRHNIKIIPSYIQSEENVLADTLSRLLYFTSVEKLEKLLSPFDLCCCN